MPCCTHSATLLQHKERVMPTHARPAFGHVLARTQRTLRAFSQRGNWNYGEICQPDCTTSTMPLQTPLAPRLRPNQPQLIDLKKAFIVQISVMS